MASYAHLTPGKPNPLEVARLQRRRKVKKAPDARWYNGNSLLGNDWAIFYMLIGAGNTGKSYWTMKHVLSAKYRDPKNVKVFWTRLTDAACDRLLARNADHLVDPDLYRRFGKELKRRGNTVYYGYHTTTKTKTGKEQRNFVNEGELLQVHPLSTFFNNKGEALFDNEFNGDYYIVLDEMNREAGEANRFDIVEAFANQLENFTRDSKCRIRVICIGNNMAEISDILAAFNFIPKGYGRYKLKRRKCVIDVIEPSAAYHESREQSAGFILAPDAKRFTTVNSIDERYIANKEQIRTKRPLQTICFGKRQSQWYTINSNNIISKYNKEDNPRFAMRMHLGEMYSRDFVVSVEQRYNSNAFLFDTYATYLAFIKDMSSIKK